MLHCTVGPWRLSRKKPRRSLQPAGKDGKHQVNRLKLACNLEMFIDLADEETLC